jgi:hypothetical protein
VEHALLKTGVQVRQLVVLTACSCLLNEVKKKTRKATPSVPAEEESPDWLEDKPFAPYQRYAKASLDDLAADIEQGIRDLPVWKDYVRRFGWKAAREILRRGLVINQITDGNPGN